MRICLQAPLGVALIVLNNHDEAFFLNGQFIADASWAERDDPVSWTAELLAEVLGVPFTRIELETPANEDWSWNDITDSLGWNCHHTLPAAALRSVLTCSTAHITLEDKNMLDSFSRSLNNRYWVLKSHGYMLRYDGQRNPELYLKRYGFSRSLRRIVAAHRRAGGHMLRLSPDGDILNCVETFEW
ncbi:DUF5983 family protein [Cronobacter dublinensis]|uniref:DUF5983 family protein n=1 Tax=Cronobacter dublinensis TaxID=413497 RepID=UPI000CFD5369|nr:DUF5983 family protein [Cronobacter dublinensis]